MRRLPERSDKAMAIGAVQAMCKLWEHGALLLREHTFAAVTGAVGLRQLRPLLWRQRGAERQLPAAAVPGDEEIAEEHFPPGKVKINDANAALALHEIARETEIAVHSGARQLWPETAHGGADGVMALAEGGEFGKRRRLGRLRKNNITQYNMKIKQAILHSSSIFNRINFKKGRK